jgi:hypothetical protein
MDAAVDATTTVSCAACAYCTPNAELNAPFARCTDTISCAPGFTCFNYGVQFLTTQGPPENVIEYVVEAPSSLCLEAGGPLVAPAWDPCDGGAVPVGAGSGSGANLGAGSNSGSGSATPAGTGGGGSSGLAAMTPIEGANTPIDAGGADAGRDTILVLGKGACDVGGGAAANGLPLLGVIALWIARRRRRLETQEPS